MIFEIHLILFNLNLLSHLILTIIFHAKLQRKAILFRGLILQPQFFLPLSLPVHLRAVWFTISVKKTDFSDSRTNPVEDHGTCVNKLRIPHIQSIYFYRNASNLKIHFWKILKRKLRLEIFFMTSSKLFHSNVMLILRARPGRFLSNLWFGPCWCVSSR